jgi:predicted RNA-binding protein associated with RNAse of E/G family
LSSPTPREICVVYRRLPNDIREFPGVLRRATKSKLIIESPIMTDRPTKISGEIIADIGYMAIWFVYIDRWYDIGKFYDKAGRWLGYYCDIITPVKKLLITPSRTVALTDLFLDLWIDRKGRVFVLDDEELSRALEKNQISARLASEAARQIHFLARRAKTRQFPPLEVRKIRLLNTPV